jgi:hypothetical protein
MARRTFLLDKSGSMDSILDDTIGGFNSFVRSQIHLGGTLSLYTFSDECTCEYKDKPIVEVPMLTRETYVPGGSTALYDSMGHILSEKPSITGTFVILTDGQENMSKKYTKAHVKDLIEFSSSKDLNVMYVGVDIEDAVEMGIENTLHFDTMRTPDIFRSVSESVSSNVLRQTKSQPSETVCSTKATGSKIRLNTSP